MYICINRLYVMINALFVSRLLHASNKQNITPLYFLINLTWKNNIAISYSSPCILLEVKSTSDLSFSGSLFQELMSEDSIFLWINMVLMKKRYGSWLSYDAIYSHGDEWKVVHLTIITCNLGLPFKTPWGKFWRSGAIRIIPVSTAAAIFLKVVAIENHLPICEQQKCNLIPYGSHLMRITHNNHSSYHGEHIKRSMAQSIIHFGHIARWPPLGNICH